MGYLPYSLEIKVISWLIVIVILAILATYFYIQMFKVSKEIKLKRQYFGSLATWLFCYMITRIFFIFSDIERDLHDKTLFYYQLVGIGHLFNTIGVLFMIYIGEKYFLKNKRPYISYILSSIIIVGIIALFFPQFIEIVRNINLIDIYFSWAVFILIFITIYRKTTGKLRRVTLISILGILIALIGAFIETDFLLSTGMIPPYLTPIIFSVGILIIAISQNTAGKLLVEFYTGKKICLVHKGEIEGKISFCPKCFVSYCENCFNSVIIPENHCWFCNSEIKETVKFLGNAEQKTREEEQVETSVDISDPFKK